MKPFTQLSRLCIKKKMTSQMIPKLRVNRAWREKHRQRQSVLWFVPTNCKSSRSFARSECRCSAPSQLPASGALSGRPSPMIALGESDSAGGPAGRSQLQRSQPLDGGGGGETRGGPGLAPEEVLSVLKSQERFQNVPLGRLEVKSQLAEALERALAGGDHAEAQRLSAQLEEEGQRRQLAEAGARVLEARVAKEVESRHKKQKRPTLHWGLGSKERWERKGNM